MEKVNIKKIRVVLFKELKKYKESGLKDYITLDIDKKILHDILFEDHRFALPDDLWKLLDLSNVSFDYIDVITVDFTGSKGVVINPQKVCDKSLLGTKLTNVEIKGSFDDVNVYKTDFTGSKGAVINPQKVSTKDLSNTKLTDAEIKGSFKGVCVEKTDFTGSKGVIINPQKVCGKSLLGTKLTDVKIKGSFDGVIIYGTDFTGSSGAKMDIDTATKAKKLGAILKDVEIIEAEKDITKEVEDKIVKTFQKKLK